MQQPLKIAITGASGFIGRHLLEDIAPYGYKLFIITRNPEKKISNIPPGSKIIKADLTDYSSLQKAFEGIDIIVNIAAEVRNESKLTETNILGTENLIKAAAINNVSKIIHISSVGVVGMQYSNTSVIIDESSTCEPKNEYERTKLASEKLLLEAHQQNKFGLTILRPTNVYGEHHPFNALLNLVSHVNSGKIIACTNRAVVNYVYVKDLTSLIIKLIIDGNEYGIINAGNACSVELFFQLIAEELKVKEKIIFIPQLLVNFVELFGIKKLRSVSNRVIYSDKKSTALGEYPYGYEKGIARTINYYRQQNLIK
jgi:nucleoside-diphosphate-sugar epimerase